VGPRPAPIPPVPCNFRAPSVLKRSQHVDRPNQLVKYAKSWSNPELVADEAKMQANLGWLETQVENILKPRGARSDHR
jgi:hypothetical protein